MSIELKEAQSRKFLLAFAADIDRKDRPTYPTREACLMVFLNDHDILFRDVREKLSKARVRLMQSARLMSNRAGSRKELENEVTMLSSKRQEMISDAVGSMAFQDFMVKVQVDHDRMLAEWSNGREMLKMIRQALEFKSLPTVKVEEMDPALIISAFEDEFLKPAKMGDVVLRRSQPHHHLPEFSLRTIGPEGLPRDILGNAVGLLVTPHDKRSQAAIAAGAKLVKGRFVMPLDDRGLPAPGVDWDAMEPFLPLAAKRTIVPILPDLIPSTSWGASLANLLTPASWNNVRSQAVEETGGACMLCGRAGRIEVHEIWEYGEPVHEGFSGIQKLSSLSALCSLCHEIHHLGLAHTNGRGDIALARLRTINRWDRQEGQVIQDLIFRRHEMRSQFLWSLDLSIVQGKPLQVRADWSLTDDGWIEHGRSDPTRLLGATWSQGRPRIEVFDPVPQIHFVGPDDEIVTEIEPPEEERFDNGVKLSEVEPFGSWTGGFKPADASGYGDDEEDVFDPETDGQSEAADADGDDAQEDEDGDDSHLPYASDGSGQSQSVPAGFDPVLDLDLLDGDFEPPSEPVLVSAS